MKHVFTLPPLLLLLLLIACSDDGDPTGPGDTGPGNSGASLWLEVEPASFLLTEAGENTQLSVRAFDSSGQPVQPPPSSEITWRSLDPNVITVDADGEATAAAGLGSAQVVAEWNGATSNPALGLVARPAAGALLVADSQVVGTIRPDDSTAEFGIGWRYVARLSGVDPSPGQIVIGAGEAPLAGRVVATTAVGADIEATLELIPLGELLEDVVIDERFPLVRADRVSTSFWEDAGAGVGRSGGLPPAAGAQRAEGAETEFDLGPFSCTASGSAPELNAGNPTFDVTGDFELAYRYSNGQIELLAAEGEFVAALAYQPRFEATFEGQVGCETIIRTFILPVSGWFAVFFGAQVPAGIGMDLDGKLTVAEVGFDVSAEAKADVMIGVECPGGADCSFIQAVNAPQPDAEFKFEPSADVGEQFRVELGGYGYGLARLTIGSPLREEWQWEVLEAKAGAKQAVNLASTRGQAADTDYASDFNLTLETSVGAGEGLQKAIEKINEKLGTSIEADFTLFEHTDTLATSPRGTFTITPASVEPGDDQGLGEMATFTVSLDPVTYLGAYAVDGVEIRWKNDDENGGFTLENGRPGCTTLEVESSGQTVFECETDFPEEHLGEQTFYAFVDAELFGFPLPVPLEISNDGKASVAVGGECPTLASGFSGVLWDTSYVTWPSYVSGASDALQDYSAEVAPHNFGDMALSLTATAVHDSILNGNVWVTVWGQLDQKATFHDSVYYAPADAGRIGEQGLYGRLRIQYGINAEVPEGTGNAQLKLGWGDEDGSTALPGPATLNTWYSDSVAGDTTINISHSGSCAGCGSWIPIRIFAGGRVSVADGETATADAWVKLDFLDQGIDSNGDPVPMVFCSASGEQY